MSEVLERRAKTDAKVGIIDSDIHPTLRTGVEALVVGSLAWLSR